MNEKVLKCLYDIKFALEEIDTFFVGKNISFDEYKSDVLIKRAVERNLEIIGEAMHRILHIEPNISIDNAHRIVGLRNQIIHGYDNISDENIWAILQNHLPDLKKKVIEMIGDEG